jgi:cyclase
MTSLPLSFCFRGNTRAKILILSLAAILGAQFTLTEVLGQQPPPAALVIQKVKDDLYNIVGSGGNVAALVTNEGVILVDDKFEQNYDAIVQAVKSVTDQPIKYVFNTHYHSDHSGGNTRFLSVAEVISHKNSRDNILGNKQSNASPNMRPARIVFTDQTSIFLGGKEVRAGYFGRGHTNGDIVIYFPALRVIHTGDLMAGTTPLIDYSGGGSFVEWSKTMDAVVAAFDFDTVIPGHGTVTDKAGLKTYRDNVAKLRTQVTNLIKQGKKAEEIRTTIATEYPAYADPKSLNSQWSIPGFMTELK